MKHLLLALFPGILFGITILIIFTSLATTNETAQAYAIPVTGSTSSKPIVLPTATQKAAAASSLPTTCTLPSRYPASIRQWCGLIEQEAKKNGIESRLIAAVMLQESGGNAKAYSRSGAVGLLQVMPRDGIAASFQCKNGPCFATRPTMAQLYDPEYNVNFGAKMLAGLIKKSGNVRDALKAYGPMDAGYTYADKVLAIYSNYK